MKTKENLIKELQELQMKYDSLKTSYEKDINEHKREEEALWNSEAHLRTVLDATPFPIALVDVQDNNIDYWSHSAFTLFGHTAPTSQEWYEIAYPDPDYRQEVIDRWKPSLEKAQLSGHAVNTGEYRITCRNGSVRVCELYASFLVNKLIVTFNDITEKKLAEEKLLESERELNILMKSMINAFVVFDPVFDNAGNFISYRFIYINDAYERITGVKNEEVKGKTIQEVWPETEPEWIRRYGEVAVTGVPQEFELYHDPTMKLYHCSVYRPRETKNRFCVVFEDITERKQGEKVLEEERNLLRTLVDLLPSHIFVKDRESRFLMANFACARFMGATSPNELIGKTDYEFYPSEVADGFRSDELNVMEGIPVVDKEEGSYSPGGVPRNLLTTKVPLRDGKGNIIGLVGTCVDITERKNTEEALIESEDKFKYIFDHSIIGKSITLTSGEINVNKAFCDMLGYSSDELNKKKWQDITHPDDIELTNEAMSVIFSGEEDSTRFTKRYLHKNGSVVWADIYMSLRWDADYNPLYIITSANNITERVLAEKALTRQNDLLSQLNHFSIELAMLSPEDNLEAFITRRIKEIAGARAAIFSDYNPEDRTTTTRCIEIEPGLLEKVVNLLGRQISEIHSFVNDEMYREMTTEIIGVKKTLHEASFGAVSRPKGAAIQALLNVDRIIGVAYLVKGKLYGTSLLAMSKGQPDPPMNIFENFIFLASVSLARRRAEESLRLEKENFRYSLDDSPLGVRIVSAEGDTIYANRTILNFYGYDSLVELQKTPLKKRYTPDSYVEALKRKYQRDRGDLSTTNYEINIVRKNGEIRHLQVFRKKVLWNGIWRFQILYVDITERKQAEEDIRKSKKLLEDLHKHLNEIRENERAVISREIHDRLGQSMTALKLDLNRMHKHINSDPEAISKLDSMIKLVSDTIKDVQRISSDLRPGILDDLGLVPAIEWYCDEFEKRTGIRCKLKSDNSEYSDPEINLTFFRVLQETLTNVIRHANASSVTVKLHRTQKGIILTIQDNGIGIPREKIESPKSLGLIGMRERVRQFEGKIDISLPKGKGTMLTVFIPVRKKIVL